MNGGIQRSHVNGKIYKKDKNYFTTLTLETNEQTLLQTVLPLHKIQVPSPRSFLKNYQKEDRLDCANKKKPTTTRTTTTNQRLCFKKAPIETKT